MTELDKLLGYCGENDRVCPMPLSWHQVWDMLPGKKRGSGWEPPPPLILAAWWETSDQAKREHFELHLRWRQSMAHWTKWRSFSGPSPKLSGTIVAMPPFEG
jgi:hypothetical protein